MPKSISPRELKKQQAGARPPNLIDVRRKTDYETSPEKITGAAWKDPEKMDSWIKDLPPETLTVVYCVRGGNVSQGVAERLQKEGFQAFFLEGGLKAWQEDGQNK